MSRSFLASCLMAATIAGCGGGTPQSLVPKAPHGGLLFSLPDGAGSVEVLKQPMADRPGELQLVTYFLGADVKPMASPPTSAVYTPKLKGAPPIDLKPLADGLATGGLPSDGEIAGSLTATVGGKPITIPINVR